jgi:hypothetical protein
MSTVVNWGHWIVGILFTISGLGLLISETASLVGGVRNVLHGEPVSFYSDYLGLLWSATTLLCAWGIFKWRLWAHYLALFFGVVNVVVAVAAVSSWGLGSKWEVTFVSALVLSLLVTTWLLLPAVRRQYVQRSLAI